MASDYTDPSLHRAQQRTGIAPWPSLVLMYALTIMSLIDRLILALLVAPLKADLGLSNVQLGLLFGTAFALFYGLMGLPIARIADNFNRVRLVTIAVVFWSLCTIASGFATEFWHLLALRAGLAVGEAALFPTIHSLIYDMFDERRRATAASVIMTAPPLGGAMAFALGGWLVGALGEVVAGGGGWGLRSWQLVFIFVGVVSLLLGLLFWLLVREPARGARVATERGPGLSALTGRRAMFALILFGGGLCQVAPYAYTAWGPTLLTGKYGFSIAAAGASLGAAGAMGSILGSLLIPLITLRLYDRGHPGALALVPMLAVIIATVILALAPLSDSPGVMLGGYLLGAFFLLGSNATVMVAMQRLSPDNMRATMIAATLLVSSALGLGLGPVLVAWLADSAGGVARFDSALSMMAIIAGVPAVIAFVFAWRRLAKSPASSPAPAH